jgi:hypothetical protein
VDVEIIQECNEGEAMKTARIILRGLAMMTIVMLMLPFGLQAEDSGEPDPSDRFSMEELAQMLAPIALYPDSLIAQILMASTYPLEVVGAERWIRENKGLKGDDLDKALQEKTWDPSVKSLCHYPDILFAMSGNLDQTRKLGDAYLAQPDDVMATVQELRRKAEEQGNLKTTKEQNVIVEQEIIRIEPATPEVVYLPVYNPLYVYGPWWYPAYPPWNWYYPPGFVITGGYIAFSAPFFIYADLFSWSWFDWHSRFIYVDYYRTRHFHRHHRGDDDNGKHQWKHEPRHRRGVAYRDMRTSDRFGNRSYQRTRSDAEMRGYPPGDRRQRTIDRSGDRMDRRGGTIAPGKTIDRERSKERIEQRDMTAPPIVRTDRERFRGTQRRETPFRGVDDGNFERRAGERGSESLRSGEMRRPDTNIQRQGGGRSIQPQRESVSPPGGGKQDRGQGGVSRGGGQGGGYQDRGLGGGSRK